MQQDVRSLLGHDKSIISFSSLLGHKWESHILFVESHMQVCVFFSNRSSRFCPPLFNYQLSINEVFLEMDLKPIEKYNLFLQPKMNGINFPIF